MNRRNFALALITASALTAPFTAFAPPPKPPADPAIVFKAGKGNLPWRDLRVCNADGSNPTTIYTTGGWGPSW